MSIQLAFALVLGCSFVSLSGCATRYSDDEPIATQRRQGNATVRAVAYVEAAANVAPQPAKATPEAASKRVAATPRGKQDKKAAASPKRGTEATRPAPAVPGSTGVAGRGVEQQLPVTATGYRYSYAVEMDDGSMRTLGFANDQGLQIGDRVSVNGPAVVLVRN